MSQRIRYTEISPKIFKSKKNYQSTKSKAWYFVKLNMNEVTFQIHKVSNRSIIKSGGERINNLTHLKKAAKTALIGLGVEFSGEIRDNTCRIKRS